MAEVTHTPGPWKAERRRIDGAEWFVKSSARDLPPYDWHSRMTVKIDPLIPMPGARYVDGRRGAGSDDSDCCPVAMAESAANARLIAASPDMLEALEQLLDDMGEDGLSVCQEAKDQARAALSKAKGETT